MRILIAALLLAAGGATAATSPEEERLIAASIAQLKTDLPDPSAAQFRKVYFFRSTTATGARHLGICGQMWVDDPRAPVGWTMFGGTMRDDGSEILQYWGPMAVRWCAQPYAGDWDYSRDMTARYQAAMGGGRP